MSGQNLREESRSAPLDFSLKILLVDDMPAMRSILRGMLEEIGFTRIVEAEDGEIAWQLIRQSALAGKGSGRVEGAGDALGLVIADWQMPAMSGVDLLRAIRNFPMTRSLPFLMVTAKGDVAHVSEATRAGVTDYVVKPFSATQLFDKICAIFGVAT